MTSELRVTTLSNATGDGPATLTQQSACKAWAGVTDTAGTTIDNSLNVSSLSDQGTGDYDYTLTNNASSEMDAYAFGGMTGGGSRLIRHGSADTTTSVFDARCHNTSGTATDMQHNWMWVGDLA
jgi:hypothetical protein